MFITFSSISRTSCIILILITLYSTNSVSQTKYLKVLDNPEQYEILDELPLFSISPYYRLIPGQVVREVSWWTIINTNPQPSDIKIKIHTLNGVLVDQNLLNNVIDDLNDLYDAHYHGYNYTYSLHTYNLNDAINIGKQSANCNLPPMVSKDHLEIDIYIDSTPNVLLSAEVVAKSYPQQAVIISEQVILEHYILLAHEIYHLYQQGFCDNTHIICENESNILHNSISMCNRYIDASQLRKSIENSYIYDHQTPAFDKNFPIVEACVCNNSLNIPFEEQLRISEEPTDTNILEDNNMQQFILENFTIENNKKGLINKLQQRFETQKFTNSLPKTKDSKAYFKRIAKADHSLLEANIINLLHSGIDKKYGKKIGQDFHKETKVKKLYDQYYKSNTEPVIDKR